MIKTYFYLHKINFFKSKKINFRFGSAKKEFIYEQILRKTINLPAPGQYNEVDPNKLKKSPSKLFR